MRELGEIYNNNFQENLLSESYIYSSKIITKIVLEKFEDIKSVVDFGCGVGNFLAAFKEMGVMSVLGLDGPWYDERYLRINKNEFIKTDLENVSSVGKFDLAISLEVAEHLPQEKAKNFIRAITDSADLVLFSAAIPFQGGVNHINEQMPDFWVSLFAERGYFLFDSIRSKIWNDEKVCFWYRQNVLMFVKEKSRFADGISATRNILPAVCEDLYLPLARQNFIYAKSHLIWGIVCKWKKNIVKFNKKLPPPHQKIAIWGGGVAGVLLYEHLTQLGIEVECILDKNSELDFPYSVPIMHISQMQKVNSETIIISILGEFVETQNIIPKDKNVLFLKRMIEEL